MSARLYLCHLQALLFTAPFQLLLQPGMTDWQLLQLRPQRLD
jgi:hypothetical protein